MFNKLEKGVLGPEAEQQRYCQCAFDETGVQRIDAAGPGVGARDHEPERGAERKENQQAEQGVLLPIHRVRPRFSQ